MSVSYQKLSSKPAEKMGQRKYKIKAIKYNIYENIQYLIQKFYMTIYSYHW